MDAPIKVIKNFLQDSELQEMMEYIDLLEETIGDKFSKWQDNKRLALQFGKDLHHKETSSTDLSLLSSRKEIIQDYFSRIVVATKKLFDVSEDLYVSSFWVAKQYPGATVIKHEDTDDGDNTHFRYSGVLYLNTMEEGGELYFSDYNYSHKPDAGDLVVFPSQGSGEHEVAKIVQKRYSLAFWMTDLESMRII
jgi:hypothetical protein